MEDNKDAHILWGFQDSSGRRQCQYSNLEDAKVYVISPVFFLKRKYQCSVWSLMHIYEIEQLPLGQLHKKCLNTCRFFSNKCSLEVTSHKLQSTAVESRHFVFTV